MAEKPTCENCRYAHKFNSVRMVECHRYPPTLLVRGADPWIDQARYPNTAVGDWCGEYAPANPETVDEAAATMARLVLLGCMTSARAMADKLREDP